MPRRVPAIEEGVKLSFYRHNDISFITGGRGSHNKTFSNGFLPSLTNESSIDFIVRTVFSPFEQ